jgi:hypothetical protein
VLDPSRQAHAKVSLHLSDDGAGWDVVTVSTTIRVRPTRARVW